jgi:hypothetical protein
MYITKRISVLELILRRVNISVLCIGLMVTAPVLAQEIDSDDKWEFKAAFYLWGAGVDMTTQIGNEVDISFDDLLDNLDMAFMGTFEARTPKWSTVLDVIYLDESFKGGGTIGSIGIPAEANVDLKSWIVGVQGARTVLDVKRATLAVLIGARYLDMESKLTLRLGTSGPTLTTSASGSALDGVVGIRGTVNIAEKWYLPYHLDAGAGESDFTWQGLGGIGYRFKWVNVLLAYRHIRWELGSNKRFKDVSLSGPTLGVMGKF